MAKQTAYGVALKAAREALRLSQSEIAAHVGKQMGTAHRWERGFTVPTMADPIEVGATVRWSDDKATGIQFDGLRAHQVRLDGGDASSDSYCYSDTR